MTRISPFLNPGTHTTAKSLALVQLSRANVVPVILNNDTGAVDGYAEGTVINTRFGSFPHSTLINQPWGSQIRASIVDTGSRGRKRKLDEGEEPQNNVSLTVNGHSSTQEPPKKALTAASSGFVHVLPPTPEQWTTGLPHRTQVVYTPDYSYILHRIRARPGSRIIEAGAGSGSFTHASARAVFNGFQESAYDKLGKVFSFEFNDDRFRQMEQEVEAHGLDGLVEIRHRDVYKDGFLIDGGRSPNADCVFLDLPAPWKALPHLSRSRPVSTQTSRGSSSDKSPNQEDLPWISPLRTDRPVHICTFSPCIEQVTRTVQVMRTLGWMDIDMVEVAHSKISVMRERIGLSFPMERGNNQSPMDVSEAMQRLREVDERNHEFRGQLPTIAGITPDQAGLGEMEVDLDENRDERNCEGGLGNTEPLADGESGVLEGSERESASCTKMFMLGRLVHRTEPEIKSHTSYLVFAVMPQEWTDEQETEAFRNWPCGQEFRVIGSLDKETRKQEKRELLVGKADRKKNKKGKENSTKVGLGLTA